MHSMEKGYTEIMLIIALLALVGTLCYWLGRARNLNKALQEWSAVNAARAQGASPEALVNTHTGQVLEPGDPGYDHVARKSVRFQ